MSRLYKIRNWEEVYENAESRKVKKLSWVAIPNKHDGNGYARLRARPDAIPAFSGFILMVQIASKCQKRGVLADSDGNPLTTEDMAFKTGFPVEVFDTAIKACTSKGIQWIEVEEIDDETLERPDEIPARPENIRVEGKGTEGNRTEQNDICTEPPVVTFPVIPGKTNKATEYHVTQPDIDQLRDTFPAVDPLGEIKKALAWINANPSKRKTATGMPSFLYKWMSRCQNNGGSSPQLFRPQPARRPEPTPAAAVRADD